MMKFKCPSCGNQFRVPESAAGKKGNCKKCGQTVRIPDVEKEAIPVVDETNSSVAKDNSESENPDILDGQLSIMVPTAIMVLFGILIFGFVINSFIGSSTDKEPAFTVESIEDNHIIDSSYDSAKKNDNPKAEISDIPKTDLESFTRSLKSYLNECNSRIDSIKSNYQESLARITPSGEIDIKRSDSALNPYYGVLIVEVDSTDSISRFHLYRYEFTIKPSSNGGWDFVECFGGPPKGKYSVWSLRDLAYQHQGQIAMEWLLGREKSRSLLRTAL